MEFIIDRVYLKLDCDKYLHFIKLFCNITSCKRSKLDMVDNVLVGIYEVSSGWKVRGVGVSG